MKYFSIISVVILLCSACKKERQEPLCLDNLKPELIEIVDRESNECGDIAYMDEYEFLDGYVYFIPTMCYSFFPPGSGYIVNEECTFMTEIGLAIELEFEGQKFSETAILTRRVWSYEK